MATELIATRKSVNALVRAELKSLLNNPALSSADNPRLQQRFDAIRDAEGTMGTMGSQALASDTRKSPKAKHRLRGRWPACGPPLFTSTRIVGAQPHEGLRIPPGVRIRH